MLLEISFKMIHRGVFENPAWDWTNTLVLTLAGFFIVFLLLMILIIIFTVFGKIMAKVNAKEAAKKAAEEKAVPAPVGADCVEADDETAAVIVAAITEASGGKNVIIKEIKEASK